MASLAWAIVSSLTTSKQRSQTDIEWSIGRTWCPIYHRASEFRTSPYFSVIPVQATSLNIYLPASEFPFAE